MTAISNNAHIAAANAELALSLYDAFNRGDFDPVVDACRPDVAVEFVAWGRTNIGRDAVLAYLSTWKEMAPDGVVEVLAQIGGDEGVVSECVFRGVNTGVLAGPDGAIAPTGRTFAVRFCEIQRIVEGQLVSVTNYADMASLFAQLGLLPESPSA